MTAEQLDEGRLDQAPLVMAFLGPGIGKKDMDPIQLCRAQAFTQKRHGVFHMHAHMCQRLPFKGVEQAPHAGLMDFDAQHVPVWMGLGEPGHRLPGAESDFQ